MPQDDWADRDDVTVIPIKAQSESWEVVIFRGRMERGDGPITIAGGGFEASIITWGLSPADARAVGHALIQAADTLETDPKIGEKDREPRP